MPLPSHVAVADTVPHTTPYEPTGTHADIFMRSVLVAGFSLKTGALGKHDLEGVPMTHEAIVERLLKYTVVEAQPRKNGLLEAPDEVLR